MAGQRGGGGGQRRESSPDSQYEERVIEIRRVAKVVKGGRRFSFSALVVVGDGQRPGRPRATARPKKCPAAIQKGIEEAKKNLFAVPLAGSHHHPPDHRRARRRPRAPEARRPRYRGHRRRRRPGHPRGGRRPRRAGQVARARPTRSTSPASVINGLQSLKRPDEIARLRGKSAEEVTPAGMLRAYTERNRRPEARRRGRSDGRPARRSRWCKSAIGSKPKHPGHDAGPRAAPDQTRPTSCPTARRSGGCSPGCRTSCTVEEQ